MTAPSSNASHGMTLRMPGLTRRAGSSCTVIKAAAKNSKEQHQLLLRVGWLCGNCRPDTTCCNTCFGKFTAAVTIAAEVQWGRVLLPAVSYAHLNNQHNSTDWDGQASGNEGESAQVFMAEGKGVAVIWQTCLVCAQKHASPKSNDTSQHHLHRMTSKSSSHNDTPLVLDKNLHSKLPSCGIIECTASETSE